MFDFNNWLNRYPYTDFHELNIDWIIKAVKEIAQELGNFELVNQIKYGGTWDITKQYSRYTVVVNGTTGYISLQDVPAGVAITNTDYWELVADFTAIVGDLGTRVTALEADKKYTRSYFSGKKIVSYGDSTIHNGGMNTYIDQLDDICDCTVTNRGIAGTRMARNPNNGVSLINASTDLGSFDIITLSYGMNEWQTNETVSQIYEDAHALITAIKNKNPDIDIVFITPFYAYRDFGNDPVNLSNSGLFLYDVNNIITYVMNSYSIPVIDLYSLSMCNEYNYSSHLKNDSGGVYVHPEDWFSRDLAYIVKSFNTGAVAKTKEIDILATYDLYSGQTAFTNTDYNNAGGLSETGLFLHYGGSTSESTIKKTVLSDSIYRIKGKTSAAFTLSTSTWNHTFPAGSFDITVSSLPTGFNSFTITTTGDTVIEDFHIYKVILAGKEFGDNTRFGARCSLTILSEDVTALTGRYAPSVVFERDHLVFDFAGFQVTNEIAASTDLLMIPYSFTTSSYLHSYIYAVKSSDGEVYPLELQGERIKSMKTMPTGTYIISNNIDISRNISVINS